MLHLANRAARLFLIACALAVAACTPSGDEAAEPRTEFNIGWSIYAGWMPWPYAEQSGIVKKWADKYGLEINFVQVNDYVESVNQYTAGKLDGVTVANMDALTIPAAGGKDTSAIILGDYSNGNDAVLLKDASKTSAIKGRDVYLVELSVSHYLLARALETNGLAMTDVKTMNTSDADIAGAFSSPEITAAVAWNPQVTTMKGVPGTTAVFTSADIPGEILDLLVVDTATLKANPNLGKALAGIWYETMTLMAKQDAEGAAARAAMAKLAGTTSEAFEGQLATTYLYTDPAAAVAAMGSPDLVTTMTRVRDFSFAQGLFGQGARSADAVGMEFPGGKTLGDEGNITLRFDPTFMQLAAEGAL
ncbi:putative urea ABC transporter substrate-binding protein [Erythrobacter sanguineus]|jgi:NitT/TauT family transport system substrate-binding protein|uniref:NitT/TauT family transport system substrate-binding protein n=1 Tax=Erythrobacter sanguineus TaxID=198312 RepID=A0A1M7RQN6_9SPHN|nr:putative urea ABC transporter substrate-binding protein [Erythrobacter sanguineus]SHN48633.1 NitT/TauT family transport system substrate-binding protein [Erythrobacter sanguineus]